MRRLAAVLTFLATGCAAGTAPSAVVGVVAASSSAASVAPSPDPSYTPDPHHPDLEPPHVVSVTVEPAAVDVSAAEAHVTVRVRVTDNLSGVGNVQVSLVGSWSGAAPDNYPATLTSGTRLDGELSAFFTVSPRTHSGWFYLAGQGVPGTVDVVDRAGNWTFSTPIPAGSQTTLTVTNGEGLRPVIMAIEPWMGWPVQGSPGEWRTRTAPDAVAVRGTARPGTAVTLWTSDATKPNATAVATARADGSGVFSVTRHYIYSSSVSVATADGRTAAEFVPMAQKVSIDGIRYLYRDAIGRCVTEVRGGVYPFVPGARVILRSLGSAWPIRMGTSGRYDAHFALNCGQTYHVYAVTVQTRYTDGGTTGHSRNYVAGTTVSPWPST